MCDGTIRRPMPRCGALRGKPDNLATEFAPRRTHSGYNTSIGWLRGGHHEHDTHPGNGR
jgi:hypothetical protein